MNITNTEIVAEITNAGKYGWEVLVLKREYYTGKTYSSEALQRWNCLCSDRSTGKKWGESPIEIDNPFQKGRDAAIALARTSGASHITISGTDQEETY